MLYVAPRQAPFPLEIGPWSASGSAQGTATASEQGLDIVWRGRVPADFDFVIEDGGAASGTWSHAGDAIQTLSGSAGGQSISATGFINFSGNGAITGTNSLLTLNGSSTTSGSVVATVSGRSVAFPVDGTNTLPALQLEIAATTCDEAYGEWAYSVVQGFEGAGFEADFGGYWHALRGSAEVTANIASLFDAIEIADAGGTPDLESQSPLLLMSAQILAEYNAFVDTFPGWTLSQVLDIAARTEALLAKIRNLTECDRRLFGDDNVELFVDGLTFLLQGLIIGAPADSYTSSDFAHLVHVAVRNGALGPGAPNPAQAVNAETALIRAGEAILAANVDPADNKIFVNDDTKRVMATGAAMDWSFTVAGTRYNARATYENALGDTWRESAPETEAGE